MTAPALILPMAGRGSRFAHAGEACPKPLVMLHGRPFFWWAAESVCRATPLRELLFVVLEEHVAAHGIDRRIAQYYPRARVIALTAVTAGAAETARVGVDAVAGEGPILVNDCDHAFEARGLSLGAMSHALFCFDSADPAYSYAALDGAGRVAGTVEKRVVSRHAIAGCYAFASAAAFRAAHDRYRATCPYAEQFVSGLYNLLLADGAEVARLDLAAHRSFGTPAELARVANGFPFLDWLKA